MVNLSVRDKALMCWEMIWNPVGVIFFFLMLCSLVSMLFLPHILCLFVFLFLVVLWGSLWDDVPRRIWFLSDAMRLVVDSVSKERVVGPDGLPKRTFGMVNWSVRSSGGEKVRMVYHGQEPPVRIGQTILVVVGWRGHVYGFRDVRHI